jgi:hypothetical protein
MSANYSYDKLPIVHETSHDQDITEYARLRFIAPLEHWKY